MRQGGCSGVLPSRFQRNQHSIWLVLIYVLCFFLPDWQCLLAPGTFFVETSPGGGCSLLWWGWDSLAAGICWRVAAVILILLVSLLKRISPERHRKKSIWYGITFPSAFSKHWNLPNLFCVVCNAIFFPIVLHLTVYKYTRELPGAALLWWIFQPGTFLWEKATLWITLTFWNTAL